jgi:endonuclease/exonuclease/phosphatase family metal-dependent hydrolase
MGCTYRLYIISSIRFFCVVASSGAELKIVTWNLHDFPSHVHDRRMPAKIEARNMEVIAREIRSMHPDIVILQEIRDASACSNLCIMLGNDFRVSVCSGFADRAGIPLFQQVTILSRLPATTNEWHCWNTVGVMDPPRGYAMATFAYSNETVRVFSVHLKSNLTRGNAERENQLNILKRELAVEQLLHVIGTNNNVVVGGDFNTDMAKLEFVSEHTLLALRDAGFVSCYNSDNTPITCPGRGQHADATFDYLWCRGRCVWIKTTTHCSESSDHCAVGAVLWLGN